MLNCESISCIYIGAAREGESQREKADKIASTIILPIVCRKSIIDPIA
jgi:hypothetical protein